MLQVRTIIFLNKSMLSAMRCRYNGISGQETPKDFTQTERYFKYRGERSLSFFSGALIEKKNQTCV